MISHQTSGTLGRPSSRPMTVCSHSGLVSSLAHRGSAPQLQGLYQRRRRQTTRQSRSRLLVAAGQVLKVDAERLQQEITERTTPLVIDFYATWCGPCLLLAKELEKAAEQLGDKVKILKVDTDENPELSNQLRIEGLPTMVFVGTNPTKPAIRTEGLLPAETIVNIVNEELANLPDAQPAQ